MPCDISNCKLKETCPGANYCWCGECSMKDVFDRVTEKAPKEVHYIYRNILKAIAQKRNVFLTASAGNGKSFFLDHLCKSLVDKITVTATTGIAALNVGGATLHSTLGLGLGKASVKTLVQKLTSYKLDFLNNIDILAIDEVSMLSGELLDKCNEFLKLARMDNRPFGGIQVILIGDFCQLPPVDENNQTKDFCFFSNAWKELNLACFELKHNFRQQDDPKYSDILKKLRKGELTEDGYNLIMSRTVDNPPEDVPRLYATNNEVREYNRKKLDELGYEIREFRAEYTTPIDKIRTNESFFNSLVEKMKKSSINEDILNLCEGARVMLTRNQDLEKGLVNGSLGYIQTFCDDGSILVNFDNGEDRYIKVADNDMHDGEGKVILTQKQYPLKLAFSCSIHKSQGQTLDKVFIDFDRFFEVNQAYVALSRVKKSNGLYVKNFTTSALRFSPIVLSFYNALSGDKKVDWINYTYNTINVS